MTMIEVAVIDQSRLNFVEVPKVEKPPPVVPPAYNQYPTPMVRPIPTVYPNSFMGVSKRRLDEDIIMMAFDNDYLTNPNDYALKIASVCTWDEPTDRLIRKCRLGTTKGVGTALMQLMQSHHGESIERAHGTYSGSYHITEDIFGEFYRCSYQNYQCQFNFDISQYYNSMIRQELEFIKSVDRPGLVLTRYMIRNRTLLSNIDSDTSDASMSNASMSDDESLLNSTMLETEINSIYREPVKVPSADSNKFGVTWQVEAPDDVTSLYSHNESDTGVITDVLNELGKEMTAVQSAIKSHEQSQGVIAIKQSMLETRMNLLESKFDQILVQMRTIAVQLQRGPAAA